MDERLLVPVDDDYLHAVGRATFCFARLEWGIVWCCEKLSPNYINGLGKKTAGKIAEDFFKLAANHHDALIAQHLTDTAVTFRALVKERNSLVHGKPGTAPNGDQRLFHKGEWSIDKVNNLADEFAKAEMEVNAIFLKMLGGP